MRIMIVLCAGSRIIDGIPLYLQRHPDGMLIAEKAIQGVYPENYDRIVYSVLKEADEAFDVKSKLLEEMGNKYPIEIIDILKKTSGPAETVYETLTIGNIDCEIVIRDSHNYIEIEQDRGGNFIAGLDLITYDKTIEGLRTKSFITLNGQSQVLDVVEKRFCSDVISAGLYGFKKASDFKLAYEHLSDPNYPIKKLYVSHIISYLIGYKQRIFHSVRTTYFEDWATSNAWNKVQRCHSTCFLDLDEVCGVEPPFDDIVITNLKKASTNGCLFIGYSRWTSLDKDGLIGYMRENGINIQNIVTSCTFSKSRVLIEDRADIEDLILEG